MVNVERQFIACVLFKLLRSIFPILWFHASSCFPLVAANV